MALKRVSCLPMLGGFCVGMLISASLVLFATPHRQRNHPPEASFRGSDVGSPGSHARTNNRNLKNDESVGVESPPQPGDARHHRAASFQVAAADGRHHSGVPRFARDELSMRKLLYSAVNVADFQINRWGKAVKETWGQYSKDYALFISTAGDGPTTDINLPVVTLAESEHGDAREKGQLLQSLKYACYRHVDSYSWFLILPDHNVYIDYTSMEVFLRQFNNSQVVYMGTSDESGTYCLAGPGFILSRKALQHVCPYLDECFKESSGKDHGDKVIGQCVHKHADIHCTPVEKEYFLDITSLPDLDGDSSHLSSLQNAISVYPVVDIPDLYRIHHYKSKAKLEELKNQRERLVDVVETMDSLMDSGNSAGGDGMEGVETAGMGGQDGGLDGVWEYAASAVVKSGQLSTKPIMGHASEAELRGIITDALRTLPEPPTAVVADVYRRCDAQHVQYRVAVRHGNRVHHVDISQGLGKMAALSAQTLTTARMNFVVVLSDDSAHFQQFMHNFEKCCLLDSATNSSLLVLISKRGSHSKPTNIMDLLALYQHKYPAIPMRNFYVENETTTPKDLRATLEAFNKDDLLIILTGDTDFNNDFLQRCQLAAIYGHQLYNPIPFQFFNNAREDDQLVDSVGFWDSGNRNVICGYQGDIFSSPVMDKLESAASDHDTPFSNLFELITSVNIVRTPDDGIMIHVV